jgi:hypothetical protein
MGNPERIPDSLSALLRDIAVGFPAILGANLVGIYLWGSLTYEAFDERYGDVDCIVVTRKDLAEREFSILDNWFADMSQRNSWVAKLDMRFVIDGEFLDKTSRCCGFQFGKFVRHGSDGNPFIWINIGDCGVTLWGKDAKLVAPAVDDKCLSEALLLELNYLKEDLAANAGDRSEKAFQHLAYAILTACRILYTAYHKALVSKERALDWAIATLPSERIPLITTAMENRRKTKGVKTGQMEKDALDFVHFIEARTRSVLEAKE